MANNKLFSLPSMSESQASPSRFESSLTDSMPFANGGLLSIEDVTFAPEERTPWGPAFWAPAVVAPVKVEPGEEPLFHYDRGLASSARPAHPSAQSPEVHTEGVWLRHKDGKWQRKVLLDRLTVKPHYNGLHAWAPVDELVTCSPEQPSISVELADSQARVMVHSNHLFVLCPHVSALHHSLLLIEAWISPPTGGQPVLARLVVDSGCELEGALSSQFVSKWGWHTLPSLTSIRTASGERVSGIRHILANTHFTPGFTRRVAFGVLDLPGIDGILGVGFLNKFMPYSIQVTSTSSKALHLTVPKTKEVIVVPGTVTPELTCTLPRAPPTEANALLVQWTPPSLEDLEHIVGQFHLSYNPVTKQATLELAEDPEIDNVASWLDDILSPEAAEGVVFLAAAGDSNDRFAHVPLEHRQRLQQLLAQFSASVFRPCDFPPFPPERDVEFKIQLEAGAQVPASGVHKLSPALIEQLRVMLQELLHNGLIVPTSSPFAAPLLLVKKPDG